MAFINLRDGKMFDWNMAFPSLKGLFHPPQQFKYFK